MSRLNIILVVGLLLLSLSSFAEELAIKEPIDYSISLNKDRDSEPASITQYNERVYDSKSLETVKYIDTKIESAKSKIELQNVRVERDIPEVKIQDGKSRLKGSDIITINDIELDLGIITLEKYYIGSNVSLLYSKDGIDYELSDINFMQNSTHLWFNTTHFSSFTTTMPDIKVWTDGHYANLAIDLADFATITSGHTSFVTHIITDGTSSGNTGYDDSVFCRIINDGTNDVGEICALEGNIFQFYSTITSGNFLDSTSGARFSILDAFDNVDASSNQLDIIYQKSFEDPDVNRFDVDNIVSGSVRLRGRVYFNDVAYISPYYENDGVWGFDSTGNHLDAQFYYRKQGTSIWNVEDFGIINSGTIFSKTVTGLDDDSTYEYYVRFYYFNPEDNFEVFKDSTTGTFETYTEPVPTPSVQTLSPSSITDTTATLRGVADFDGYTGTVTGLLCYRETGVGEFACDAGQTISDGTTFTRELTGLTADTEYEYVASITWDSESDTGSVVSFTTNAEAGETGLLADLVSYYKLDENTGTTAEDSHGSNDGTITSATWTTGKINSGLDFGTEAQLRYVDIGTTSKDIGNHLDTLGISFWMSSTYTGSNRAQIMGNINDANTGLIIQVYLMDSELIIYSRDDGGDRLQYNFDVSSFLDGDFHHFVINYKWASNEIELYINNEEQTGNAHHTESPTLTTDFDYNLVIGAQNNRGTIQNSFDGKLDEIAIRETNWLEDEISELWNNGNGLSYDNFDAEPTPTTETLTVTNKASTWAVLSQIPSFNDYTESVDLFYQIIKSDDAIGDPTTWDWDVIPSDYTGFGTGFTASDNTLHQINMTNLEYDTKYYVQGAVSWDDGTFYSEYQTFTTDTPVLPEVETIGAIVGSTDSVLRGRVLSLGDFTTVDAYIILNGTEVFTVTTSDFGVEDGIQGHTEDGLEPLSEYCYIFGASVSWTGESGFNNVNIQGNDVCFNTTAIGDPVINTLPASNILRESATLRGEIFDLGIHSEIPFWFRYSGLFTEDIVDSFESDYDGWSVTEDVERLNNWSTQGDWSVYIPSAEHIEKEIYVSESNPYIVFDVNLLETGFNQRLHVCVDDLRVTSNRYDCLNPIHTITTIGESLNVNVSLESYIGQEIKIQFISVYVLAPGGGSNSYAQIDNVRYSESEYSTLNTPEIPYTVEVEIGDNINGLTPDTTYTFEAMTRIDDREISGGELEFTTLSLSDFIGASINEPFLNDKSYDYIELIINVIMNDVNESILSFNLYDSSMSLINTTIINVTESGNYNTVFTGLDSQVLYYYDASIQFQDDINETQSSTSALYSTRTLDVYVTPTTLCVVDRLCIEISNRYLFSTLFIVALTIVGLGLSVGSQFSQFGAEKILVYGITALSVILSIYMFQADVMPPWMFLYLISGTIVIVFYYITRLATGGSVYG